MSNTLVGEAYQKIIQEVIDTSLVDFEEAGVSAATLEDLKKLWQQKLSDLHVAHFPWEPTPPPSQPEPPNTKKNAAQQPVAQIRKDPGGMSAPQPQNGDGPRIKTEPGLEAQGITALPLTNSSFNPQLAAIRAQQNIQQKFGGAAVPMLAQQQQHQHQQQQQNRATGISKPPGGGLMLPGLGAMQPVHQNVQNGIPQHDGADDADDDVIPVEGWGTLNRQQADSIILRKLDAAEKRNADLALSLQGLSQKKGKGVGRRHRVDAYAAALSVDTSFPYPSSVTPCTQLSTVVGPSQVDGPGSDDGEDDADAINSDLDDPDDEEIDNDDDDESPQIMLCMYDKVQRTKNKWKCVLKDGVLTINGKEYVFSKATGEYEW